MAVAHQPWVTVNMLSTGEPPEGANVLPEKRSASPDRCAHIDLNRTRIAVCQTYHEYERGALPRSDGP